MKERPIIFSGPMVRAILEGRKTQFRRIVKPQPPDHSWSVLPGYKLHAHVDVTDGKIGLRFHHSVERQDAKDSLHQDENWIVCPLGNPGGRLWVKETHWVERAGTIDGSGRLIFYKATDPDFPYGWKPSIHMPRWASRITLEIADVRVERLNDISERDCLLEGFDYQGRHKNPWYEFMDHWKPLHGPGSWAANPWVWVYTFKMVDN